MRPFVLPILAVLLAGPASRADDAAKPAASSSDEIASFALKGFNLASIKTFDFAPDVGSCLVGLTMSLGPLGILAVNEDDEPDVLADCRTAELPGGPQAGGTTLSVTAVTLSDPPDASHRVVGLRRESGEGARPKGAARDRPAAIRPVGADEQRLGSIGR